MILGYDPTTKQFLKDGIPFTDSHRVASGFRIHADESAKKELNRVFIDVTPWPGCAPFAPAGLTPKDFQIEAALFALSRNRSYLALDPGLGKTIVIALVINALRATFRHSEKVVIINPPALLVNTAEHLKRWCDIIDEDFEGIQIFNGDISPLTDILIVPDSMIHRKSVMEAITNFVAIDHATLFVDEAQRFKSPTAKRCKAILGRPPLTRLFEKSVFLSGTPIENRTMEIYPVLKRCAPESINFMDRFDFGMRYCAGHLDEETGHFDFSGDSHSEELFTAVKKDFMLRMKKTDVMKELPPKVHELVFIGENLPPRVAELDRKILKEFSPTDLMKAKFNTPYLSTYRRLLGIEKASLAIEYVKNLLTDTDENVLVFAIHKDVVQMLVEGLKGFSPLVIVGAVDKKHRQGIVDEFQNNPKKRLFIGNIDAAGVGFTLTKATQVIMVERSWKPSANEQASDRAHRIGQTQTVFVKDLVFVNSVDRVVIETGIRKSKTINVL